MSDQQPPKSEFECKHALYFTANDGSPNDLVVVKEYEYKPDGTRESRLRQIYNYQRPFYITKEPYRNHKDKKEWEKLERLQEWKSSDINMPQAITRALGRVPTGRNDLRQIAQSPYVYGTDVPAPVLIKQHYLNRWPNRVSDNLVAVIDSETDMFDEETGEIIMLSITMRDRARLVVVRSFLEGMSDEEATRQIYSKFQYYLGDMEAPNPRYKKDPGAPRTINVNLIEQRGIKLEIEFVDNGGAASARIIETAHEWGPDFVSFWNINFDMKKMIEALNRYGYNLPDVFSDPSIPREFRYFDYKEGPAQKVTASGKTMALAPAERWHEVICPAKWYALDAMCVYLKLRIAGGKDPSYSLDAILDKELGIRKLKFKEADHLTSGKGPWHRFMQKNFKIEYCVYNIFDCISVEILDEQITDLRSMISLMTTFSEYKRFPSQPRRTCDDLHFMVQKHGLVAAATSNKMVDENDQYVIDITDWIVTLPSHLVADDGLVLLKGLPNIKSFGRAHVADLDVEGTYPNVEIIMNISKATTAQELCMIRDIPEIYRRAAGVNLSGGFVNAVEICQQIHSAPSMEVVLREFQKHLMDKAPNVPMAA